MIAFVQSQKKEKPGQAATVQALVLPIPREKEIKMNDRTNNTILAGVQNMSISELSAFSASMRRMLETTESIASLPRCQHSEIISEILDEEMDRFGQNLDMAAAELARRVPTDDEEAEERTFGLTALACAARTSLEDFVAQFQEGDE